MASPTALITGAGSGIGRATAILLSQNGYRLALAGRREVALRQTAAAIKSDVLILPTDVGNATAVRSMVDDTVTRFGRLAALINNAGLAPRLPIGQHTPDLLEQVYRVNALGPAWAIARAWPVFVRQNAGCIINISTMGTIDPYPGLFGYAAAKAAVNLMAKACANEGREHRIRAFSIAPGAVDTDMLESAFPEVPKAERLSPQTVARLVVECLRGDRDAQNGQTIPLPSP